MPLPSLKTASHNPLFLLSISALFCLLLSSYVYQMQRQQLLTQRDMDYGNALARLAAIQATDATLNHDLVSLQVTVRDVARNPRVLNTTIHDVENQLLVQAGGHAPARGLFAERPRSFTAPITLQDSIAGYVTVTLEFQEQDPALQEDKWMVGLIGLSLALLALSLLSSRREIANPDHMDPEAPEQPHAELPSRDSDSEGSVAITLKLRCLNIGCLQQQLSSDLFEQILADLQHQISGVVAIYGGRLRRATPETMELQFLGDEVDNTVFRAICAASLLFRLQEDSSAAGVRLHLAAVIFPTEQRSTLNAQLENWQLQQDGEQRLHESGAATLLLHTQDCSSPVLRQRLVADEPEEGGVWLTVSGLQPAYATLLDRQCGQLAAIARASAGK